MTMTEEMTLTQLLRDGRLTMDQGPRRKVAAHPKDDWAHWETRCRLNFQGRQMQLVFKQGMGHHDLPTRHDVMSCVLMDSRIWNDADTPGQFAREFGYEDLDEALAAWESIKKQDKDLRKLLGDEYDTWVYAEDDWAGPVGAGCAGTTSGIWSMRSSVGDHNRRAPMNVDKRTRMLDVAREIQKDARADSERWEGAAFTGQNVSTQLGEIRGMIWGLARLVEHLIEETSAGDPATSVPTIGG